MEILVFFLLSEILVLLIWLHCPFWDLPLAWKYGCFQPPWFKMYLFLHNQVFLQLDKINLQLIWMLTLWLLPWFSLPPPLPLHLVKVLVLVTKWLEEEEREGEEGEANSVEGKPRNHCFECNIWWAIVLQSSQSLISMQTLCERPSSSKLF